MKKLNQITLLMAVMVLAFAGCDAVKDVAGNAGGAMDGVKAMAGMDFGGMDAAGLTEKFTGVTDGLMNVTSDNVDGLTEKVTELDGVVGGIDMESLPAPAKTALSGMLGPIAEKITAAMDGISDEGIMGKLKPAVEPLLEKIKAFM